MPITALVATPVALPARCGVSGLYDAVHFADAFAIRLPAHASRDPEVLARFLFSRQPSWIAGLMRIRDLVVACFGLKTARQLSAASGQGTAKRIGIFRICERNQDEIVMGEDDKHLDFRVSLLCSNEGGPDTGRVLTLTTVVHCHNLLGRAYIAIIAPFHRMVVKASLRRAASVGWPP